MLPFIFLLLFLGGLFAPGSALPQVVPGAFIVEFEGDQAIDLDVFYREIRSNLGYVIKPRLSLAYRLFNGASFTILTNDTDAAATEIANHPAIRNIWPLRQESLSDPQDEFDWTAQSPDFRTSSPRASKRSVSNDTYEPHILTQVDLLHAAGYTGKGVKIGIIDTGVDYTHPVLGGCFGPGCVISYGYDFVDDDGDPMDGCSGHGTHVAGIIAAQPNTLGFLGVAPDADIGMYQIQSCTGYVGFDGYIAAFNRAVEDGSNIISASLGSGGGWPDDPYPLVLQRIVESGVPIVVSAGNYGVAGLFRPTNPAAGRGVLSIASVDPSIYPHLSLVATLETDDSRRTEFSWVAGNPFLEGVSLQLYHLGGQTSNGTASNGCSPLGEDVPNLKDYIVLVDVGSCGVRAQTTEIVAKGGEYIMFISPDENPERPEVRYSGARGVGIVAPSQAQLLLAELAAGKRVTVTIPDNIMSSWQVTRIPNTVSPGFASDFSSWGPNWDLTVKPNLAAPGSNLLSTYPTALGGYLVGSGTSMACPFAAGVMALVGQARGTFDPETLMAALATSSRQLVWHDTQHADEAGRLASVAQTGAGLVQGMDAANVKAIITPTFLALNDTEYSPGPLKLSLRNTGTKAAAYTLGHRPAVTMYFFEEGSSRPSRFPNDIAEGAFADLVFNTTIQVAAGSTVEFSVGFVPPRDVDAARLPVYSGYLTLSGTNGDDLAVPYLGVAASMRSVSRILDATDPTNTFLGRIGDNPPVPIEANTIFSVPAPNSTNQTGLAGPRVNFNTIMGTIEVRVDLIPSKCTALTLPKTEWLGRKSLGQIPAFPSRLLPSREWIGDFSGTLADGTIVPEGKYKFLVSALRIFGDRERQEDWDEVETVPFLLEYVES